GDRVHATDPVALLVRIGWIRDPGAPVDDELVLDAHPPRQIDARLPALSLLGHRDALGPSVACEVAPHLDGPFRANGIAELLSASFFRVGAHAGAALPSAAASSACAFAALRAGSRAARSCAAVTGRRRAGGTARTGTAG